MPFSGSSAWNTATAAPAKAPVYIVRFDGYNSVQFSSGPVASPSRTTKQLLRGIDTARQRIDPLTGIVTTGGFSFELVDSAGEITALIATEKASPVLPTLLHRKVTILAGYADIAETDYQAMGGLGYVLEVEHSPGGVGYEFSCGDPKRKTVEDLFTNADAGSTQINRTLSASAAAGSIVVDPNSITNINEDDKFFLRNGSGQEERIEVERVTGSNKIVTKTALQYSYSPGDEIRWATTILEGNPINMLYALLTGDFFNGTFPVTTKKGIPTGLGIAAGDIDTTMFQTERDAWMPTLSLYFEIKRQERGLSWIASEINRFFGYLVTTPAGQIGFKALGPRRPTETIFALTENDILDWQWERRYDLACNRVVVRYGYDIAFDRFVESRTVEDTTDQATVGIKERIIESKGFQATSANQRFIDAWARRHLLRYLKGPVQIRVRTHLTKRGATLGETVDLTHSAIPSMRTGTRGESPTTGKATGTWEIIGVEQDFRGGVMDITMLDNNWTRPAFIAPAGQPDFGSASSDQKRRAYISPAGGGNFSDGSEPYKVI